SSSAASDVYKRQQQTLTRTFKNYFDVPPHKYRMTNMQGESRFLHPLNHYNS
ncbi:hypothetical protein ACX3VG_06700, partial [Escherichia coli]